MGLLRRSRAAEPEGHDAAAAIGDVVALSDVVPRRRVRTTGQVVRMRARPTSGEPSLAVTLSDGSATITVVWTGRRAIGGVTLGRHLVVEGVCRSVAPVSGSLTGPAAGSSAGAHAPALEMTNPAYTLLP